MDEDRRSHRFYPTSFIVINHILVGRVVGYVLNMSESGVFVSVDSTKNFFPSLLVDAKIIGKDWDETPYPLEMEVVRVETDGVALKFAEPLKELVYQDYLTEQYAIEIRADRGYLEHGSAI